MKNIKKFNLFESNEDEESIDYEFIRDCFLELMDDGVKVNIKKSDILGHSGVHIVVYYGVLESGGYGVYKDEKDDLIDNLIKKNTKKNTILEMVNVAIDRVMGSFNLKLSIINSIVEFSEADNYIDKDEVLEIEFVKMRKK